MKSSMPTGLARIRLALVAVMLTALAACATPFNANVSRFQSQLPPPTGQTVAVVADNPSLAGGIEFGQYAAQVADNLRKVGYTPVSDPSRAELIARFDYTVDNGHTRVSSTGFRDPFWGSWYGGGRYGYGPYFGGSPWRYGWYDPWFDNSIDSYTVYTSLVDLKIERRATGQRLFEGRAQAVSTSNRLGYLVPNLVQAVFTNFPGNSGETVRISVAPEKVGAKP